MEGNFLRLMVRIKHTGIVTTTNVSAITSKLDKISNGGNNFKSFILEIDGTKNCRGKGKLMGDINMWKF